MGLYGAGLSRPNESRETVQVTCTLEVPLWGESRRPVPTAASVAAVELGLCQAAGELSPALLTRTRRFARHSWQSCASFVTPGLSTDCKLQRTGRSTERFSTDQDQDFHPTDFHQDHEKTTSCPRPTHSQRGRSVRPFIPLGFLLCPPSSSCGKLRERGRSSVPAPHSQNRPMSNDLPDRRAGKTGGKIRAPIGIPSCFSLAFSESLVPFAL